MPLLNLAYFGVEFAVGFVVSSVSLFADGVDFLEDASVNLLILTAPAWGEVQRGVETALAGESTDRVVMQNLAFFESP